MMTCPHNITNVFQKYKKNGKYNQQQCIITVLIFSEQYSEIKNN